MYLACSLESYTRISRVLLRFSKRLFQLFATQASVGYKCSQARLEPWRTESFMTHIIMPEVSPVALCELQARRLSGKVAWERKLPLAPTLTRLATGVATDRCRRSLTVPAWQLSARWPDSQLVVATSKLVAPTQPSSHQAIRHQAVVSVL